MLHFNSSMVRLKAVRDFIYSYFGEFQFQYGTIESVAKGASHKSNGISIPVWYDWKLLSTSISNHFSIFQFQYGTIERMFEPLKKIALK